MSENDSYVWLEGIMADQKAFESSRVGTDGTLYDFNSPEYILSRGIIGEASECLSDLVHGSLAGAKFEAVDILIFLASLFNHLGMTAEDVEMMAKVKMKHNYTKYDQALIEGKTIEEGMKSARLVHDNGKAK